MREILFRGKRLDDGRWVYGYLVKVPCAVCIGDYSPWWISVPPVDPEDDGGRYNIDPATVGQYTGLTDKNGKNGKRIFEGDIVEGHFHSVWRHDMKRCEVAYGRNGFECRSYINGLNTEYFTYKVLFSKDVAVIGNIHDNPELLEGGVNDG